MSVDIGTRKSSAGMAIAGEAVVAKMSKKHVAVVGAGIVGIACAAWLQRSGYKVTVFDEQEPGRACSFGNAGVIAPGACLPMAMPGIWKDIPQLLLNPLGPLTIRPMHAVKNLPWLMQWLSTSSLSRVNAISKAMRKLHDQSLVAYDTILKNANAVDLVRRTGQMYVSSKPHGALGSALSQRLLQEAGVRTVALDAEELHEREPSLSPTVQSGLLFPDNGHVIDPFQVVQRLADQILRDGGAIVRENVVDFDMRNKERPTLKTASGTLAVNAIVIAAGAWSSTLTRMLGTSVPLAAERGYHVTMPNAHLTNMSLISVDHRVSITPMACGLRFAGTVEIADKNMAPNWKRADMLLRAGRLLFPKLEEEGATRWMGPRPALPDGLPVIDRSPNFPSVVFAFGHAHYGLTGAAITGKLVAELVDGSVPSIDLTPYAVGRFS